MEEWMQVVLFQCLPVHSLKRKAAGFLAMFYFATLQLRGDSQLCEGFSRPIKYAIYRPVTQAPTLP